MSRTQQSEPSRLIGEALPLAKAIIKEPVKQAVREVLQEEGLVSSGGSGSTSSGGGSTAGSESLSEGSSEAGGESTPGDSSGGRSMVVPIVVLGSLGVAYALKKRGSSSAGPRSDESSDIGGLARDVGSKITAKVGGGSEGSTGSENETDAGGSSGGEGDSSGGEDASEESQEDAPTASS